MTLLTETISSIESSGHTISDITFIGSKDGVYTCTWAEFCYLADEEYDSGYGGQEVASDLLIVFTDGQTMWRGEYDGSEWWEYSEPFTVASPLKPVLGLFAEFGWDEIRQINDRIEKNDSK